MDGSAMIDPRHEAKQVLLHQYHLKPGMRIYLIVKARRQWQMIVQPAIILYRASDQRPAILTFGNFVSILLEMRRVYQRGGIEGLLIEDNAPGQVKCAENIIHELSYALFGKRNSFQIEWVDRGPVDGWQV